MSYNQGYADLSLGPRIPNGWRIEKLGNVASYVQEKVDNTQIDKTRYISTENLIPNRGGILVSSKKPNESKINTYLKGDILFSNIRPYFKKIWMAKFSGGCSNDVLVIRPNSNVNADFIYYYLSQEDFFDYATLTSKGTKMPRGDKEAIMNFLVNVPPIYEQNAIAKILSDLDEKIELNNQMNKTLEEIAQAIFKRWFIDFEFPNENGDPYKSSGGEMVESELGMIPKGWYVDNLGKFVEVVKGCSYNSIDLKPSNTALVTLKSINRGGGFNKNGYKEYVGKYRDNQIVKEGDILLAQTDLTQNGDVLGRPAFFHGKTIYSKVIASLDLQIIRPSNGFSKYFVYYLLETDLFHEHALSYTNGTTVLHLDKNAVSEFRCIIPKNEILDLFDASISQILRLENNNLKEVNHLTEIRNLLLPKLMTGRIRVPLED